MHPQVNARPLYSRRNPGLGRYSGTRRDWSAAWQYARQRDRAGIEPDASDPPLKWKACMIAAYGRAEHCDPLSIPVPARLEASRAIDRILAERPR